MGMTLVVGTAAANHIFPLDVAPGAPASEKVDHDVDIAACRFGIRACLMCGIHEGLSYVSRDAWYSDIETSLEEISSVGQTEIDFRVDGRVGRERHLHLSRGQPHRSLKACRPTAGEQLFRIRAVGGAPGRRKLDILIGVV